MTFGFSNVDDIDDFEKSTFIGEVKANSLTRMYSRVNVIRTGTGSIDTQGVL